MKYEWMSFKSRDAQTHRRTDAQTHRRTDAQTLEADVEEVLAGFGERYKLDFC